MFGATAVFHLASVVFILALLYQMIRWKKKNQRLLELLAAKAQWRAPKVAVEWPEAYLGQICEALNIPFVAGQHQVKTGPAKVQARLLLALYEQVQITHMQLGVDHPGLDVFFISRGGADALPRPESMAKELGVSAVRYVPESSSEAS